MQSIKNPEILEKYENYDIKYKNILLKIRNMIFETSERLYGVNNLSENLKWNQLSYSTKYGSPIRLDAFDTDKIGIFFNCKTILVEKFKILFGDTFSYSKNRAIILNIYEEIPENELYQCIEMALSYHKMKKEFSKII